MADCMYKYSAGDLQIVFYIHHSRKFRSWKLFVFLEKFAIFSSKRSAFQ